MVDNRILTVLEKYVFSRVQKFHWILKIRPELPYFAAEGFSRALIFDIVENVSEIRANGPSFPCDVLHLGYKHPLFFICITVVHMPLVIIFTTSHWAYLFLQLADI